MGRQGGRVGTGGFCTSHEGMLPRTQQWMGSTTVKGVLSICSSWLADGGVTDGADGGMQIGRCRWRGADGTRCRWGRCRKPLPAPSQRDRGKRNGCTTLHLLGKSPRPLFSHCGFYIIACQVFGASEAHPNTPRSNWSCCLVFPTCLAPFQPPGGDGTAPSWGWAFSVDIIFAQFLHGGWYSPWAKGQHMTSAPL